MYKSTMLKDLVLSGGGDWYLVWINWRWFYSGFFQKIWNEWVHGLFQATIVYIQILYLILKWVYWHVYVEFYCSSASELSNYNAEFETINIKIVQQKLQHTTSSIFQGKTYWNTHVTTDTFDVQIRVFTLQI